MANKMKKNNFVPILILAVVIVLVGVGYFSYKNYLQHFPVVTSGTVDAKIFASKDNNPWLAYNNYTYKFSFRFPNVWNASLDSTNMKLIAPTCEGCGGASEGISISYLDNLKLLSLENVIINDFNSLDWNKKNGLKTSVVPANYEKYIPIETNLSVYIDRHALTAGTEAQEAYISSPDNKFVLKIFCSQCDSQTMNSVLSTISFTK